MVKITPTIKYLGLLLDRRWKFTEHFNYVEGKVASVTRALCAIMPNLKGPCEKQRRLYAHVICSIINYGAPIWSPETSDKKIREKLRRMQRVIAIRVIAGYRTISTDAALILARVIPTDIHAAYFRRVFLRVHDLKRQELWKKSEEKDIKEDEEILLKRQWQITLQRQDVAGARTCLAIAPHLNQWLIRNHGELTFHMTQLLSGHDSPNIKHIKHEHTMTFIRVQGGIHMEGGWEGEGVVWG
ncbi:uncharacterized protein LOC112638882 [Camponotus floridanus]|uniref:uncharacterized protein LOC112638882 n=1 Tax=Camponotus floridanus TaxID=104421 RepID=UPI000DC6A863|nr:uncharacterized protein LOC112638882 [Camponotus floridanus]